MHGLSGKTTDEEINSFYKTLQLSHNQKGKNVLIISDFNANIRHSKPAFQIDEII